MRKILLSFADEKYIHQQNILYLSSKLHFDEIISVGPEDIEEDFIKENQEIFNFNRGYGYWIWKPYFIRRVLDYINEGDILFYVDSGNETINNPQPLFNLLENQDIVLFKNRDGNPHGDIWINSTWTKADCFNIMGCNDDVYKKGDQVDGSYILLKKTLQSIQFIEEYLRYSCNKNIITDLPNITGNNEPDFRDHRHDQSILSLLAIKHNIKTFESPSESSNHIQKEYSQIFNHFRRNLNNTVRDIKYNEIYIYHHLGLGDHISCHGIVRTYCELYDKVYLFVKPQYYDNIRYMYNDLTNLELIPKDDKDVHEFISQNKILNIKRIGFTLNHFENFELQFYKMANVPIKFKHDKFFINRNIEKEKELFKNLDLKEKEYIFVHDGGYQLKEELIDTSLRIVKPDGYPIFDMMYIMENAKEIHCIDSCFICLTDCMKLSDEIKLYNHRYLKNYPEYIKLHTDKNWNFIK
jgi:hypothetical protein